MVTHSFLFHTYKTGGRLQRAEESRFSSTYHISSPPPFSPSHSLLFLVSVRCWRMQTERRSEGGAFGVVAIPLQRDTGRDGANREAKAKLATSSQYGTVGWAGGRGDDDDAAPFSMETEGERKERVSGVPCYLGNWDDVMEKVEPGSDWLTGCGAPLAQGGGGG